MGDIKERKRKKNIGRDDYDFMNTCTEKCLQGVLG